MKRNENHGEKFNAIGLEYENKMKIIKESLENSVLAKEYIYKNPRKKTKIMPLLYPKNSSIQICSLVLDDDKGNGTVETFFPVLEGIENTFIIENKTTWKNNIEGEIEVISEDGNIFQFFAPFYKHNFSKIKKGEKINIYMAGLAYFIENAVMKYEIDKGPFYEFELENFLEKNPQKTKIDFPFVTINLKNSIAVIPSGESSLYEYRGKIIELEHINFLNKNIARIKVGLEKDKNNDYCMFIYVYIAETNAKNCKLVVGKEIQCLMWLTGYIKDCA